MAIRVWRHARARFRRPWTPEEHDLLVRYAHDPTVNLARMLGRSRDALWARARRFGITLRHLPRRRPDPELEVRILDMYRSGWHDTWIARELGCDPSTVKRCRGRLGLAGHPWRGEHHVPDRPQVPSIQDPG